MFYLVGSIVFTVIFYIVAAYMSYVSMAILYSSVRYKLIIPSVAPSIFIFVCYISIITDVTMFTQAMYTYIMLKNGFFSTIILIGVVYAKRMRKE